MCLHFLVRRKTGRKHACAFSRRSETARAPFPSKRADKTSGHLEDGDSCRRFSALPETALSEEKATSVFSHLFFFKTRKMSEQNNIWPFFFL